MREENVGARCQSPERRASNTIEHVHSCRVELAACGRLTPLERKSRNAGRHLGINNILAPWYKWAPESYFYIFWFHVGVESVDAVRKNLASPGTPHRSCRPTFHSKSSWYPSYSGNISFPQAGRTPPCNRKNHSRRGESFVNVILRIVATFTPHNCESAGYLKEFAQQW